MKKSLVWIALLFVSNAAHAVSDFSPGNLSAITQGQVNELIRATAVGTDHRAYMPASPLGLTIGLDVGIDITGVVVPQSFINAVQAATQQPLTGIPSVIPVPKLNIHKGLPLGIDVGVSYIGYRSYLSIWALEAKWAFVESGPASPSVAVRGSYTNQKLWFITGDTFKLDVLASKDFILIEPYIGMGLQFWSGDLEVPVGGATGLPVTISGSDFGVNPHFYLGVPIKLTLLWITPEVDYSTARVTSYGVKLSFNF